MTRTLDNCSILRRAGRFTWRPFLYRDYLLEDKMGLFAVLSVSMDCLTASTLTESFLFSAIKCLRKKVI
jgi:hypothetical protein